MVRRVLYILWSNTKADRCFRIPIHAFSQEDWAWNFAAKQDVPEPDVIRMVIVLEEGAGYINYELSEGELLISMRKGMTHTTMLVDPFRSEHAAGLSEWHVTTRLGEVIGAYKSYSTGRCDTDKITLADGLSYGEMNFLPAPPQGSVHLFALSREAAIKMVKQDPLMGGGPL